MWGVEQSAALSTKQQIIQFSKSGEVFMFLFWNMHIQCAVDDQWPTGALLKLAAVHWGHFLKSTDINGFGRYCWSMLERFRFQCQQMPTNRSRGDKSPLSARWVQVVVLRCGILRILVMTLRRRRWRRKVPKVSDAQRIVKLG